MELLLRQKKNGVARRLLLLLILVRGAQNLCKLPASSSFLFLGATCTAEGGRRISSPLADTEIRLRRVGERILFHNDRRKIFHNSRSELFHIRRSRIFHWIWLHFCTMTTNAKARSRLVSSRILTNDANHDIL